MVYANRPRKCENASCEMNRTRKVTWDDKVRAAGYVLSEFRLADNRIDGEMVAEGLAIGYPYKGTFLIRDAVELARQLDAEWDDRVWQELAARADYLCINNFSPSQHWPCYRTD